MRYNLLSLNQHHTPHAILFSMPIKKLLRISFAFFILFLGLVIFLFQSIPQTKSFPHVQALLIHGYWLSQKGNGPVTLSRRSELEVKAAYLLYKNKKADYLFVPAGPIWGNKYPSLGEVMAKRLVTLGVPQDKIILQPTAMDTYEEIEIFLDVAKQNHWETLGDLASYRHDLTIPTLFRNQHAEADFLTFEQVLNSLGTSEDKQVVKSLTHSIYDFGFGLYELSVRAILFADPRYQLLGSHARATRNHKTSYGGIFFIPIDTYNP